MAIHTEKLTGTTSSGSATMTSSEFLDGEAKQVMVIPTTSSTTYDITIEDKDGDPVFKRTNREGTIAPLLTGMPMRKQYTIKIENASADEAFTVKILIVPIPY